MLESFFRRKAILGFISEQFSNQILSSVRNIAPAGMGKGEFSINNPLFNFCRVLPMKGRESRKKDIKDDTT
jgi:hypothetical protein